MSFERRKTKVGTVVSEKMDKTIVVSTQWRQPHRLYKKNVRKWSRFMAHDEQNECALWDTVQIVETRPMSKNKRWKVAKVLQKSDLADIQPDEISENVAE